MEIFDSLVNLLGFKGAVLLVSFIALLLAVLVLWTPAIWLADKVPYFFPVSFIRGREGKLLGNAKLSELTGASSFSTAVSILEGTDYSTYLTLSENAELGLKIYLSNAHREVLDVVPQKTREFFETFIRVRWDVSNIEQILIEKHSKKKIFEIPEDFIAIGTIPKEIIKSLEEAENVSDAVARLERTDYGGVLKEGVKEFEKIELISSLVNPLYAWYFEKCLEKLEALKGEDREVTKLLLGVIIDTANLKTILRLKKENVDIKEMYLKQGQEIYGELHASTIEGDIPDILNFLSLNRQYTMYFTKAIRVYEEKKDLAAVARILDSILVEKAKEVSASQPFGAGIILSYLILKEAEINGVKTIITGLKEGLSGDELKKLAAEAA